jgi:hypothetical protein
LLVVGRNASTDHLMNSAFGRMENAFQSGEVGGTAAALAIDLGVNPRALPVDMLQADLREKGVKTNGLSHAGEHHSSLN